jgi:outer membrane lipoprotein SlyB
MIKLFSRISAVVLALLMAACAAPGSQAPGSMEVRQGVIEQITPMDLQSSQHTGVGAVVGGLTGVGLGSLIGAGTGRDVAMVAGAIGGAIAGNEVAKRYDRPQPGQQIVVRVKSGVLVSVMQPINPALRMGQQVYIEGSGENARVLPR